MDIIDAADGTTSSKTYCRCCTAQWNKWARMSYLHFRASLCHQNQLWSPLLWYGMLLTITLS